VAVAVGMSRQTTAAGDRGGQLGAADPGQSGIADGDGLADLAGFRVGAGLAGFWVGLGSALGPHQPHDVPVPASVWADAHSG
jgi:hypothetical protein